MGIVTEPLSRPAPARPGQRLEGSLTHPPARHGVRIAFIVPVDRLFDLRADAPDGVQAAPRVRKDHGHVAASHPPPLGLYHSDQLVAEEPDGAAHLTWSRHHPEHGQSDERLAGTRLTDDAQSLASPHGQRDPVQRHGRAAQSVGEMNSDLVQPQDLGDGGAQRVLTLQSWPRPSLNQFALRTVSRRAAAGAKRIQGAALTFCRASASMLPQEGATSGAPTPRKERQASVTTRSATMKAPTTGSAVGSALRASATGVRPRPRQVVSKTASAKGADARMASTIRS